MLTNRLTTILAITGLIGLVACGDEKDEEGTTNVDGTATVTVSASGSESGSATNSATDTDSSATMSDTDASATMTDTDMTVGTETGGACPVDAECQTSADCEFGVMCVDCVCEGGDSTGSSGDDPYPPPMNGTCPAGYGALDPMQVMGGVCAPPCEAMFTCPEPTSGTATGACAIVEPGASMADCEMAGMPCEMEPEICLMFADGLSCSNPPAFCYLNCMGGLICPDGQSCNPMGICVWPE